MTEIHTLTERSSESLLNAWGHSSKQSRPTVFTSVVHVSFLALVIVTCIGCALPIGYTPDGGRRDLVIGGFAATNETSGRTQRVVFGLDIRSDSRLNGINLGVSDLRLCIPVQHARSTNSELPSATSVEPSLSFRWPFQLMWHDSQGTEHSLGIFTYANSPPDVELAFVHHIRAGAGAHFGTAVRGLEVGFASQTLMYVPLHESRLGLLHYRSRAPVSGEPCLE